ncbi:MAG: hypothetical protein ABFS19_06035 [Thermodesulfobacteriota bacterium]
MSPPPLFHSRSDCLDVNEARYYQDLLYRTLKIGTELEFALPKGVLREELQPEIEDFLQPSKDMNQLGSLGVYNVVKEHCGIEVQIIGRHPHWQALMDQYSRIILPLLQRKVRMRPTCGCHYHLLQVGLSETLPEIILANFWNLSRAYGPGLKFLTSGGDSRTGLCRRRQHNSHREFLNLSPYKLHMRDIQTVLKESLEVPEHQNFFNLEHVVFTDEGHIDRLHLEMRYPDGDLCPTSITAKIFLFLVMLLKAVEISKFGLLQVETLPDWKKRCRMLDIISNNDGRLATSDTSQISDQMLDDYRQNAQELLAFLKSIFLILDNPSELVLKELAREPISLRRSNGGSWLNIQEDLTCLIAPLRPPDEVDCEIVKIIELGLVHSKTHEHNWYKQVAAELHCPVEELMKRIELFAGRDPSWNCELGSLVFQR